MSVSQSRSEEFQNLDQIVRIEVSWISSVYQVGESLEMMDVEQVGLIDTRVEIAEQKAKVLLVEHRSEAHDFGNSLGVFELISYKSSDDLRGEHPESLLLVFIILDGL
jgi:hypothetical protein